MNNMIKSVSLLAIIFGLAACGGGGGGSSFGTPGSGSGGGSGGTTNTIQLGNKNGGTFTDGVLHLGLTTLSAGGTTSIRADLNDSATSTPYLTATSISFSSTCTGTNNATITTPVTTNNGTAISTYTAQGCVGTDTITATAVVNGATLTATRNLTVNAATAGSIRFISASPATIALKGTGGSGLSETSTVVFEVRDTAGGLAPAGTSVTFTLDTTTGGIKFGDGSTTFVGQTDAQGRVQAIVQSGTVHTTVQVTARVTSTIGTSNVVQSQSVLLTITTGRPTQAAFSLSRTILNPEGCNFDGDTTTFTIRPSDRFGNPVPDNTSVSFTAEGGQIVGNCATAAGACSVVWTSADPRPAGCRVTVLAYALGEESFTDNNGDFIFNAGDTMPAGADIGEAFRDNDEDGAFDTGAEPFIDFNVDTVRNGPDSMFSGVLCSRTAAPLCATNTTLHVYRNSVIIMGESSAFINISPDPIDVSVNDVTVNLLVTGWDHGFVLPKDTTITVTTDNGSIKGAASFTVPNTLGPSTPDTAVTNVTSFPVTISKDTTPSTGTLTVTVQTPKGFKTFETATVTD